MNNSVDVAELDLIFSELAEANILSRAPIPSPAVEGIEPLDLTSRGKKLFQYVWSCIGPEVCKWYQEIKLQGARAVTYIANNRMQFAPAFGAIAFIIQSRSDELGSIEIGLVKHVAQIVAIAIEYLCSEGGPNLKPQSTASTA